MNSNKNGLKIRWYHVPKSGGTSIFNMTQGWSNFKRADSKKNHIQIWKKPPNSDEEGLTIIRHPYSRFLSAFWHMVDACDEGFYYRHAKVSDCNTMKHKNIDFAVFNRDPNIFLYALVTPTHPHHRTAKIIFNEFSIFKPQFYWISDRYGRNIHSKIKYILNQENLMNEFENVSKLLGQTTVWTKGPKNNVRISKDDIELNQFSKDVLQKLYRDDFKHLNFPK